MFALYCCCYCVCGCHFVLIPAPRGYRPPEATSQARVLYVYLIAEPDTPDVHIPAKHYSCDAHALHIHYVNINIRS